MDLLARKDSSHRLAWAWPARDQRAVGKAWFIAAWRRRERPAFVTKAECVLCVHLADATGHLAGPIDASRTVVLLSRIRAVSGVYPSDPDCRFAHCHRAGRRSNAGTSSRIRKAILE